jgi:hypothetical protein
MTQRLYLLPVFFYLLCFVSCGGTNNLEDGGSTVGPGFYPAGDTYVQDSEQGIAIVCRSDAKIRSVMSLVTKELSKQNLSILQPSGNLSEASLSIVDKLTRLDGNRASTLKTAMTSRLENIVFAANALSTVTPVPGASIPTGCNLERIYEESNGAVLFSQELWDVTGTTEIAALLTELTIKQHWTPGVTAEKSRSLAGLLISKEITTLSKSDYEKYLGELSAY